MYSCVAYYVVNKLDYNFNVFHFYNCRVWKITSFQKVRLNVTKKVASILYLLINDCIKYPFKKNTKKKLISNQQPKWLKKVLKAVKVK